MNQDKTICTNCAKDIFIAEAIRDHNFDFLCTNCASNLAEAAWERHCAAFHDGGDTSFIPLYQQQLLSRKLK